MHDQGIETRPALCLENPRHGGTVGGVGAEAVNGLCRKGDEPSCAKDVRCLCDGAVIGFLDSFHNNAKGPSTAYPAMGIGTAEGNIPKSRRRDPFPIHI